ncbi:MAG: hypothetical protein HKN21_01170 [Candidatus Eisenbacteria bacterium]|uniref:Uncharacterized protein n=1 Tax=Eiseniibacteriota bacterium TaxID=2212470 RepID=A0A7Y2H175_UNCEI|nr:hypothetical protein [Candidatus Eisenbacteria bacterium]
MTDSPFSAGQRIAVVGGYDPHPKWLDGATERLATVLGFLSGQNESLAMLIQFDEAFSWEGSPVRYGVLRLRYTGASWENEAVCHVEVFGFKPKRGSAKGLWVESHAILRLLP